MKESNARLQALPTSSVELKNDNSVQNDNLASLDLANQKRLDTVLQSGSIESSKNIQYFETIRNSHKSMVSLIDNIFDCLQLYADESNKSNQDPQLVLHWQRPVLEKFKGAKSWLNTAPDPPAFIGKIYTCSWSLIIKGTSELVTSYVIPSDRVISFNSEPEIYSPYLTINYVRKGSNYAWQIDKEAITHEHISDLARKLLDRLLKSARSQEWAQTVFCLQAAAANSALKSIESTLPKGLEEKGVDPEQLLVELMETASKDAVLKANEFKIEIEIPNQVEPQEIKSTQTNSDNKTFEDALKSIPRILARKLEQLTEEGGEAFARHDLKKAQEILTLSNQISELKNKVEEIMTNFKIQR